MHIFGRRHPLLWGRLSVAPDWYVWLWAYVLTTSAAVCVIALTHDLWMWTQTVVACTLLLSNQISSVAMLVSDPGVFPRRSPEPRPAPTGDDADAEAGDGRTYCRRCRLRRPPRASHCYVCDVCVLEHDHHCVLLGVCVGKRSQRWFVLYLLSTTAQLYVGLYLTVLSFRRTPLEKDWRRLPPPHGATAWTPAAIEEFQNSATLRILLHLAIMALVGFLLLPVSVGTVVYVLLPLTNTTWREAQHDGLRLRKPGEQVHRTWLAQLCMNVADLLCAGPSLVSGRGQAQRIP